jgi:hypothetical protein
MDQTKFRFVVVKDKTYLRLEDVVQFIIEIGGTEETDVRNRLEEAARNIQMAEWGKK